MYFSITTTVTSSFHRKTCKKKIEIKTTYLTWNLIIIKKFQTLLKTHATVL